MVFAFNPETKEERERIVDSAFQVLESAAVRRFLPKADAALLALLRLSIRKGGEVSQTSARTAGLILGHIRWRVEAAARRELEAARLSIERAKLGEKSTRRRGIAETKERIVDDLALRAKVETGEASDRAG